MRMAMTALLVTLGAGAAAQDGGDAVTEAYLGWVRGEGCSVTGAAVEGSAYLMMLGIGPEAARAAARRLVADGRAAVSEDRTTLTLSPETCGAGQRSAEAADYARRTGAARDAVLDWFVAGRSAGDWDGARAALLAQGFAEEEFFRGITSLEDDGSLIRQGEGRAFGLLARLCYGAGGRGPAAADRMRRGLLHDRPDCRAPLGPLLDANLRSGGPTEREVQQGVNVLVFGEGARIDGGVIAPASSARAAGPQD